MNRAFLLVPVAAVLLGGCGGSPPAEQQHTGTVEVKQQGTPPQRTAWYLRIEDMEAKPVTEHAYPNAAIALTQQLSAGDYRVISWNRPCADTCPSSGENGLGPLSEVCGAPIKVTEGVRVSATVVIESEGSCSVRVN